MVPRSLPIGWKNLLLAAFTCGVLTASASDRAMPDDGVAGRLAGGFDAGVPGNVHEVRTLGAWRDGNRAGTYRVVTLRGGFDHIQIVVIIQWMEQMLDKGVPSVIAARRIELLDDLGPIAVLAVRETIEPNELNMSIQVRNVVSGEEGDVEAVAGPPGQLTARYAPITKR